MASAARLACAGLAASCPCSGSCASLLMLLATQCPTHRAWNAPDPQIINCKVLGLLSIGPSMTMPPEGAALGSSTLGGSTLSGSSLADSTLGGSTLGSTSSLALPSTAATLLPDDASAGARVTGMGQGSVLAPQGGGTFVVTSDGTVRRFSSTADQQTSGQFLPLLSSDPQPQLVTGPMEG